MKVEILYFAGLKDYFPPKQTIEIDPNISVSQLKTFLTKENPNASKILNVSRVSINQKISKESEIIPEYATIAILPPSSGG